MNKKVTFLFIGDSKGQKYFTMNIFHTKISNGEFFPNYGKLHLAYTFLSLSSTTMKLRLFPSIKDGTSTSKLHGSPCYSGSRSSFGLFYLKRQKKSIKLIKPMLNTLLQPWLQHNGMCTATVTAMWQIMSIS